jgi:hypothetical protein
MSIINQKRQSVDVREAKASHKNWMGGQSFNISDPVVRLRIAASSCFFGEPQYYHKDEADKDPRPPKSPLSATQLKHLRDTLNAVDPQEWRSMNPSQLMEKCIDDALDFDAEKTLLEAVRLRQEEHIRTTPQVILVRAANHPKVRGTGLVRKYAPKIILRADEPSTGLAYQLSKYGEKAPIPNALKKAWRDALSKAKDYDLAKYRMGDRQVKTVDVMNLVHPKSDSVSKLAKDELRTTDLTWESIISKEGSSTATWTKALDVMGHMAMLRNVRNLLEKGVEPSLFLKKLVEGAPKGKQLPFRYVSAYEAVKAVAPGSVQDAIEECLKVSLGNLPEFKGRVMSLCDNSGSAQGATTSSMGSMKVSTIANLTGVLTGMRADDGHLGVFGDNLKTYAIRKNASVFDQLNTAEKLARSIGQGTENGVWMFWKQAIEKAEKWDHVFIYSDMQAGHGGLYGTNPSEYREYQWERGQHIDVAKLIRQYRAKVNPNVLVFLVQVAGYQGTIVPEYYDRTYILGGWGEGLLRFAAEMSKLRQVQG